MLLLDIAMYIVVGLPVVALFAFLVVRESRRTNRGMLLRRSGLRTTGVIVGVTLRSYTDDGQRAVVEVSFSPGPSAPARTVRLRYVLAPIELVERLQPGTQVPVAFDPNQPDSAAILWEKAGFGISETNEAY